MSLIYKRKGTGPNTEPCGTPNVKSLGILLLFITYDLIESVRTHKTCTFFGHLVHLFVLTPVLSQ